MTPFKDNISKLILPLMIVTYKSSNLESWSSAKITDHQDYLEVCFSDLSSFDSCRAEVSPYNLAQLLTLLSEETIRVKYTVDSAFVATLPKVEAQILKKKFVKSKIFNSKRFLQRLKNHQGLTLVSDQDLSVRLESSQKFIDYLANNGSNLQLIEQTLAYLGLDTFSPSNLSKKEEGKNALVLNSEVEQEVLNSTIDSSADLNSLAHSASFTKVGKSLDFNFYKETHKSLKEDKDSYQEYLESLVKDNLFSLLEENKEKPYCENLTIKEVDSSIICDARLFNLNNPQTVVNQAFLSPLMEMATVEEFKGLDLNNSRKPFANKNLKNLAKHNLERNLTTSIDLYQQSEKAENQLLSSAPASFRVINCLVEDDGSHPYFNDFQFLKDSIADARAQVTVIEKEITSAPVPDLEALFALETQKFNINCLEQRVPTFASAPNTSGQSFSKASSLSNFSANTSVNDIDFPEDDLLSLLFADFEEEFAHALNSDEVELISPAEELMAESNLSLEKTLSSPNYSHNTFQIRDFHPNSLAGEEASSDLNQKKMKEGILGSNEETVNQNNLTFDLNFEEKLPKNLALQKAELELVSVKANDKTQQENNNVLAVKPAFARKKSALKQFQVSGTDYGIAPNGNIILLNSKQALNLTKAGVDLHNYQALDSFVLSNCNNKAFDFLSSYFSKVVKQENFSSKVLFVHGSAGVGKTQLVQQLLADLQKQDVHYENMYYYGDFKTTFQSFALNGQKDQLAESFDRSVSIIDNWDSLSPKSKDFIAQLAESYQGSRNKILVILSRAKPHEVFSAEDFDGSKLSLATTLSLGLPDNYFREYYFSEACKTGRLKLESNQYAALIEASEGRSVRECISFVDEYATGAFTFNEILNNRMPKMVSIAFNSEDLLYLFNKVTGFTLAQLQEKSRKKDVVLHRMLFIYICSQLGNLSNSTIARFLNLATSSVRNALKNADAKVRNNDTDFLIIYDEVKALAQEEYKKTFL